MESNFSIIKDQNYIKIIKYQIRREKPRKPESYVREVGVICKQGWMFAITLFAIYFFGLSGQFATLFHLSVAHVLMFKRIVMDRQLRPNGTFSL